MLLKVSLIIIDVLLIQVWFLETKFEKTKISDFAIEFWLKVLKLNVTFVCHEEMEKKQFTGTV